MTHSMQRFRGRILAVFLVVLILLSALPLGAAAEEGDSNSAIIELTGSAAAGEYRLTANEFPLFRLDNQAPGDTQMGSVKVLNNTSDKMTVRVLDIVNNLEEDPALFELLDLRIYADGKEVYQGKYAGTQDPVTKTYTLKPGTSMTFGVLVSFPADAGNEYQGKLMDSTWIFQAEAEPIKTGFELIGTNTAPAVMLLVAALLTLGAIILGIRIRNAKRYAAEQGFKDNLYKVGDSK